MHVGIGVTLRLSRCQAKDCTACVKTAFFTGGQDWLVDPTDIPNLTPKIRAVMFYHKNISYFDHLDFICGLDAATQVYTEIITQIRNML